MIWKMSPTNAPCSRASIWTQEATPGPKHTDVTSKEPLEEKYRNSDLAVLGILTHF